MVAKQNELQRAWRVLVVDDEPHIAAIVAHKFGESGAEVFAAGDVAEAMTLARSMTFDLVIADYHLPGPDGIALCGELLVNPRTAHWPVLLLSGVVVDFSERHLAATNVRLIVAKPFSPSDLLSKAIELVKASWAETMEDPDAGLATAA